MDRPKPREERRKTILRARLRSDQGWTDVTIGNVSSRGLMLHCVTSLPRNSFIEVRHRSVSVVGRIVWSQGLKCGVRTQEAVDISALLSQASAERPRAHEERRLAPRKKAILPPAETAVASRRFARAFDWAIMVVAGMTGSGFMAQYAWVALHAPLARVTVALAQG